jgi:hypothetical protein
MNERHDPQPQEDDSVRYAQEVGQWWRCPYCGNVKTSPNGTGSDVACCGEIGHAERDDDDDQA